MLIKSLEWSTRYAEYRNLIVNNLKFVGILVYIPYCQDILNPLLSRYIKINNFHIL